MLANMSPESQKQHENMDAHIIIIHLKNNLFGASRKTGVFVVIMVRKATRGRTTKNIL